MRLGVIGCGNMGSALLRGIVESRFLPARRILAWDTDRRKLRTLSRRLKVRSAGSNGQLARACSVLLLAVKPQQMGGVLKEIRPALGRKSLVISIAAGIPTRWIEKRLGRGVPVVRVMPNTPALVGKGISAVALGHSASRAHGRVAEQILSCVGEVVPLPERQLDAVTAVSGSGPAYFFYLMEQMIEAGVKLGLSRSVARRLVFATAAGAAELACQTGKEPGVLRTRVTSKGGTTDAAFKLFRRRRLGTILHEGVRAAARRSRALSEGR